MKTLIGKVKKEIEDRKAVEGRLEICEEKIKELEEDMENMKFEVEREKSDEREGDTRSIGSGWATMSNASVSSYASRSSISEKEAKKLKSIIKKVEGNERHEKRNNITIEGCRQLEGEGLKEKVQTFLKEKLSVDVVVVEAWMSGKVYVVKLENKDQKHLIMKSKGILKDTTIYIDNDLNREERQRQMEIQDWVKNKRKNGVEVKIGYGKVFINKEWIAWELIQEEDERKKRERAEREWEEEREERERRKKRKENEEKERVNFQ